MRSKPSNFWASLENTSLGAIPPIVASVILNGKLINESFFEFLLFFFYVFLPLLTENLFISAC